MVRREVLQLPSPEPLSSRLPRQGSIFDQSSPRQRVSSPLGVNSEEVEKKEKKKLYVPDYSKLRSRDESEWARWVGELTPSFTASALRLLSDRHIVEDIVQEAWIQVYQRIATIRPDNLNGYVRTIVHNKIKDHFKSPRVRLAADDGPPEQISPDAVEEEILTREDRRRLNVLLEQLPLDQRQTIHDLAAGLTPTDIERMTGIPSENIKAKRFRALQKLRRLATNQV